ncbi:MAG: TonB-dependent receptor [Limnobacter sp.]|nr:TonB-dependent receptor [Limnobacter sp.]
MTSSINHQVPESKLRSINKGYSSVLAASIFCSFLGVNANAAEGETANLDNMVVTATRELKDAFDVPASVDKITQDTLEKAGTFQVNLSETLTRVPGLVINNRNNFAQDLQISIRGFGARSTSGVRGVRLIADGIPATMPDGSGQISHFSLSSAESIEVLRGPFSSLYGNSSGGVINIITEEPKKGNEIELNQVFGTDNTSRTGIKFNTGTEDFGWVLDMSHFETDGYRNHSEAKRDNVNSKMVFRPGKDTKISWLLNYVDMPEVQDPLGLTATQLAADRKQAGTGAVFRNARKSVEQTQTGLVIDHSFSPTTGLVFSPYIGERSIRQVLGSGVVIDLKNEYSGADVRLRHQTTLLSSPLLLNMGVTVGELDQARKGFATETAPANRIESNTAEQSDQYIQAEWLLSEKWAVLGGVRNSSIEIRSRDEFLSNGDGSGAKDYEELTSNLGLTYYINPNLNTYVSYGEGFETPTLLETAYRMVPGAPNFNPDLDAAKSKQYEVGIKARLGASQLNAALYSVDTENEIVVRASAGGVTAFQNAGATHREGFELGMQHSFSPKLNASAALNIITAEYKSSNASITSGNSLPSIPDQTLFTELVYKATDRLEAAGEYRHVGRLFANDDNTAQANSYNLVNLRLSYTQPLGSGWNLRTYGRIDNLLDKEYVGSVIVNQAAGQFYEPAAERQLLVGATLGYKWK